MRSAPGPRRIDVGGHRLMMHEAGAGAPAVVIEAGGGCASTEWADILAAVAGSRARSATTGPGSGGASRSLARAPTAICSPISTRC